MVSFLQLEVMVGMYCKSGLEIDPLVYLYMLPIDKGLCVCTCVCACVCVCV